MNSYSPDQIRAYLGRKVVGVTGDYRYTNEITGAGFTDESAALADIHSVLSVLNAKPGARLNDLRSMYAAQ